MKKIILSLFAIATSFVNANAIPKIGAELGLNLSNVSYTAPGSSLSTSSITGARLGLILDAKIHGHIHLQPGVFYSLEGANISGGGSFTPNYIRVPINVIYRLGLPGVGHVYFGAGPVLGFCAGGNINTGNGGSSRTLKIGSDAASDIKSSDVGFNINAGYQLPGPLFFRLAYIAGLSNDSPQSGVSIKNTSIVVSVGWMFGGLL